MAEKFDPALSEKYYEWLSIAPEDQPPTLYRLLGLRAFEDNPKVEAESVLDDESSQRHEELSTTLVGFLEAIEIGKLKEAAEETRKKPKPAEPRRPSKKTPVASDDGGGGRKLMIGGAIGVGVLLLLVVGVLAWKFGDGKEEAKPRKEAVDWLPESEQQGEPSSVPTVTKPKSPSTLRNKSSSASSEPVAMPSEIRPRMTVKAHQHWVMSVAFSPDGNTLATGGGTWGKPVAELKLWDATTGKLKADLKGHPKIIQSVAFSPDGKTLAAGGGGTSPGDYGHRLWQCKYVQH